MSTTSSAQQYQVVIVGAGLGGLCLGALLEKANIGYVILERATKVVPLGSSLAVSPSVQALAIQLGIYDELQKHTMEAVECAVVYEDSTRIGSMDFRDTQERAGYPSLIIARCKLHDILASLVPKDKILYGKKVVDIEQADDQPTVTVHCTEGDKFHAQILVGADGAYSGVRQAMYKQLQEAGQLPKEDAEPLSFSHVCVLGTTQPLDTQVWPELLEPTCQFQVMMSKTNTYSWGAFTMPGNTIGWAVSYKLDEEADKESDVFRNAQWGPEGAAQMCNDTRDFPAPYGKGRTLGQLIDATPKDLISKIMLEEKLFTTWYHGRTVLIGDACHKMLPSAGMGANTAIMEATQLANAIFDIENLTPEEITNAFARYRASRYEFAEYACQLSKQFGKIFAGKHLTEGTCPADKGTVPGLPQWKSTKLAKLEKGNHL
ncbi:hypothetical protein DFQ26_006166 [Actinomortierella ambigua]|nr:hypothetical protein DFQ26_006166 [Actinomortierella ambigua]